MGLTSSALQSFSLHKVLRSSKSTSGSGGRALDLFWLRRDVRVGGLRTLLMADSGGQSFDRGLDGARNVAHFNSEVCVAECLFHDLMHCIT